MFDANLDEVLDMPAESIWPFLCGVAFLLFFYMLLGGHLFAVWVAVALVLLTLVGWHSREPQAG